MRHEMPLISEQKTFFFPVIPYSLEFCGVVDEISGLWISGRWPVAPQDRRGEGWRRGCYRRCEALLTFVSGV